MKKSGIEFWKIFILSPVDIYGSSYVGFPKVNSEEIPVNFPCKISVWIYVHIPERMGGKSTYREITWEILRRIYESISEKNSRNITSKIKITSIC